MANSELLQEIRDLDSELKAKNKRNKHLAKRIVELEAQNRSLVDRVNITPETARASSPALAIAAQAQADQRVRHYKKRIKELEAELLESHEAQANQAVTLHSWHRKIERVKALLPEFTNQLDGSPTMCSASAAKRIRALLEKEKGRD